MISLIFLELPVVRQSLLELIRRQQAGRPLEDRDPAPILDRKPGHWPGMLYPLSNTFIQIFSKGLPMLDDQLNRRRESVTSKKPSSSVNQRQKTSASIDTQKTTLPQIETIKQRDQAYQVRI
jgi:hypothetical protein